MSQSFDDRSDADPAAAGSAQPPTASGGRVEILSREDGVQGDKVNFFRIDKVLARVRRSSGDWGPTVGWEILERHDETAVLLYEVDTHRVLLVRQFRAPMLNRLGDGAAEDAFMNETVAGMIDAGESPEAAATRETLEETGHRLARLERVCLFYSSPGGTSERIYLFLGEVRSHDRPEIGGGLRAEGEAIDLVAVSPEALAADIASGVVQDPKILLAAPALERAFQRPLPTPAPETIAHVNAARRRIALQLVASSALGSETERPAATAETLGSVIADAMKPPTQRATGGSLFSWRRGDRSAGLRSLDASALRRAAGLDRRGLGAILEAVVDAAEAASAGGGALETVVIGVDTVGDYQCAMDWMRRSGRLTIASTQEARVLARPAGETTPV